MTLQEEIERYRQKVEQDYRHEQIIERFDKQIENTRQITETSSRIEVSLDYTAADIARLAAVVDDAMPAIVDRLAVTAERLDRIEYLLANPSETAANEFYRRGVFALTSDWQEEAALDLMRAVEAYPYHSKAWFSLGVANERQGKSDAAAEAFAKCARYSAKQSPGLAATAILLAASLYRRSGCPDRSEKILNACLPSLTDCAEIHLGLAIHHGRSDQLYKVFQLAPELAADARAASVPSVQDAAARFANEEDSPVGRLRRLQDTFTQLLDTADRNNISIGTVDIGPRELPGDSVDALLLAEKSLPQVVASAKDAVQKITAIVLQFKASADAAVRRATVLRNEAVAQSDSYNRNFDTWVSQKVDKRAAGVRKEIAKLAQENTSLRQNLWTLTAERQTLEATADFEDHIVTFIANHRESLAANWRPGDPGNSPVDPNSTREKIAVVRRQVDQIQGRLELLDGQIRDRISATKQPWLRAAQEAEWARILLQQAKWEVAQSKEEADSLRKRIESSEQLYHGAHRDYYLQGMANDDRHPALWELSHLKERLKDRLLSIREAEHGARVMSQNLGEASVLTTQLIEEARRKAQRELLDVARRSNDKKAAIYEQHEHDAELALNHYGRADNTMSTLVSRLNVTAEEVTAKRSRTVPFAFMLLDTGDC